MFVPWWMLQNSSTKLWKHRICLLHSAVVLSESLPTMTIISRDVIGNKAPMELCTCPSPKNVLPADPASEGHFSVVEPKEATRQSKCLLLKNYLGDVQIGSAFWGLLGTHFDCHNVCKFEIYRAQMRFDTWKANRCPLCSRIHMILETVPGVCTVNGLKGSRGSWTIIKKCFACRQILPQKLHEFEWRDSCKLTAFCCI